MISARNSRGVSEILPVVANTKVLGQVNRTIKAFRPLELYERSPMIGLRSQSSRPGREEWRNTLFAARMEEIDFGGLATCNEF
jgi:hypothetical protein